MELLRLLSTVCLPQYWAVATYASVPRCHPHLIHNIAQPTTILKMPSKKRGALAMSITSHNKRQKIAASAQQGDATVAIDL